MKSTPKISKIAIVVLVLIAVLCDIAGLYPGVNSVLAPIYWTLVSMYLWKAGFGFVNTKRLVTSGLSMLAELFPIVQALPLITVGIAIVIFMLKAEAKAGISSDSIPGSKPITALNHAGVRQPTQTSMPRNTDGVRAPGGGLVK